MTAGKRVFDVGLAAVGLIVLLPLVVLLGALVATTSRGPVFHRATRIGRGGATFVMLKFRTMFVDARGPAVTAAEDLRVTALGRWLRRLHLDELPQLWNVLRGEMSLVGPRPEAPEFVEPGDPIWREVLSVRPGITGPTQLEFGPHEAQALVGADPAAAYAALLPHKLESDLAYVRGRTLLGDLACILRTLVPLRTGRSRPGRPQVAGA